MKSNSNNYKYFKIIKTLNAVILLHLIKYFPCASLVDRLVDQGKYLIKHLLRQGIQIKSLA